jgi:hybrid cluster-associated redox disulfide protein
MTEKMVPLGVATTRKSLRRDKEHTRHRRYTFNEHGTRMLIRFEDSVDDVMNRWPQTIRVFLQFKMRCVGCPIACFHSVDDACREHGVDRDTFLRALVPCA